MSRSIDVPTAGGSTPVYDGGTPLNLLVVEDSEDDALLMVESLREGGFSVHWRRVETASEMKQALAEESWQAILADHRLPRFSALAAFALYREAGLDIPFVIVSGVMGEEVAVAAMKAGVHDYLMKGKLARLSAVVKREMRETEVRRERAEAEAALREAYGQLSAIQSHAPVALLVVDQNLHVEIANELGAQFAGRDASGTLGLHFGVTAERSGAEGADEKEDPGTPVCAAGCKECRLREIVLDALRRGAHHRDECVVPVWIDGKWTDRWFLITSAAMGSEGSRRALICAQDTTELKRAHLEIGRQSTKLELQAQLIELAHDAIIVEEAGGRIRTWNRGAQEMYGLPASEAIGELERKVLRNHPAGAWEDVDRRLASEGWWEGELSCVGRDGREVLAESRQVLLRSAGNPLGILRIDRDITKRRQAEDALKKSVHELEARVAERTALLQEVHHRVKNNLAVIASLLSLKADAIESTEAKAALVESQERVLSMALIHEHLYGGEHLDRVNFREYAQQLVQELRSALNGNSARISIKLTFEPIVVGIDRAVPFALILNELVCNAFKYAFPDGRAGTVHISFREVEPGTLEMAVEDDGVGLPERAEDEAAKSLGLRVVSILTRQLDGSLEQHPGPGTRFVLRFPACAS